jgi:hypothetical protein
MRQVREWLNKNSAVVTIAAVVLLILSLAFIIMNISGPPRPRERVIPVYFYDLNTNQLFVGQSDQVPPIYAPSQPDKQGIPKGVRAFVYSCGECDDESERFIAYLEMYTPEAKAARERMQRIVRGEEQPPGDMGEGSAEAAEMQMYEMWEQGRLMRLLNDDNWVPAMSEEAMQMLQHLERMCDGTVPKHCLPDD